MSSAGNPGMMTAEAAQANPLVSVIVVNYNGAERLSHCVEAIVSDQSVPLEVLVVDNTSTDDSLEILAAKSLTGSIRVLQSEVNLGYAGAVNLTLPECRGDIIAILNMDTVPESGWLSPLVEVLQGEPTAGAVNPLIVSGDGREITAAGQNIHITGLGFNRLLGRPRQSAGGSPTTVPGVQGGAFAMRRTTLEQIGGMDSSGFLYHEDVNLSWMLQLAGYEIYCVPSSVVRHHYHLSMYPAKYYLLERNRWMLLLTAPHVSTLLLISPWLIATELMAAGYCILRGRDFRRAKLESFFWLYRNRPTLKLRRAVIQDQRRVGDWKILASLRWFWEWSQFLTLARERGESTRQPKGGIPPHVLPPRLRT